MKFQPPIISAQLICLIRNSEICEHSNDDYKTIKKVLNYGNDTKLCMKKENDYIENFKETLKFDEKFH